MNDYKGTTGAKLLATALSVLVLACTLVVVGGVGEADAEATASIDGVSYCDADGTYEMTIKSTGLNFNDKLVLKNAQGQDRSLFGLAGSGNSKIKVDPSYVTSGSYSIQAYRGETLLAGIHYSFELYSVELVFLNGTNWSFMISSDDLPKSLSDIGKTAGSYWSLSEGGDTVSVIESGMFSNHTLTLYQVSGPSAYVVSFDSNGGTDVPSQTIVSGNKVVKPADPTRDGFSFTGWYTDEACTTAYNFDAPVTGNITLYAGWAVSYTVSFDTQGGTSVPSQVVISGNKVVKPADPTRDGFSFTGWYTDEACTTAYDFDTPITGYITLYAGWAELATFTVTFNSMGGTSVPSQSVVSGGVATQPADPTREGLYFTGWYTDSACTNPYDFATPVTANITLYAGWSNTPIYTVIFDSNGGSSVDSVRVSSGSTVAKPADPTRDGFSFTGWYTDEACTNPYDFATPVTGNIILYAGWSDSPAPSDDNTLIWAGAAIAVVVILAALVGAFILAKKKKA